MNVPQTQFLAARYAQLQRASFLRDAAAVEQFHAWNAQIDWDDHLNTDEYRLLPQLARNLAAQQFRPPLYGKFQGIARKAWVTNNLFFRALAPTLRNLREAKIETLVLYGGAFASRHDKEYVLQYGAADCGILVRTSHARRAYQLLAQNGWTPTPEISERVLDKYLTARFFHAFQNARGEQIILQWQLIPHCNSVDADAEFWRAAQETKMSEVPVLTLNPTAQLLHTALFGAHARGASPMLRASDVMLLLHACANEIEWETFFALAQTHRVVLPIRETFEYAARIWNETAFVGNETAFVGNETAFVGNETAFVGNETAFVGNETAFVGNETAFVGNETAFVGNETAFVPYDKINALPISSHEKTERALWNATTRRERAEKIWRIAARRSCRTSAVQRAAAFPQFLQDWWGLENGAQLPRRAFSAFKLRQAR